MKTHKGFTLIELMITVAIIGVLAAVAFPSYQNYIKKGNRAAAQAFMADVANRQKQYLLDARTYALNVGELGMTVPAEVSKHYSIPDFVVVATPPSFTVRAIPTSSQQSGDGELNLSSDGSKTPADKW